MIDEFLPQTLSTYRELEGKLDRKFLFPKTILRLIASEDEIRLFTRKKADNETETHIGEIYNDLPVSGLNNSFGACEILDGGNLDTAIFLNAFRKYLIEENLFLKEKFDYASLIHHEDHISYKDIKANKIIFADGYKAASENPYFNYLPFNLVKGEILTVEIPGLSDEYIYNKSMLLTPMENNIFKAGGTYEWDDLSENTTEKGLSELVTKLEEMIMLPYKILTHHAGVRPAVKDRRPLLGIHPHYKNIGIFNGMGTKGVLLAPPMAENFVDYLEGKAEIIKEADVQRYSKFVIK